MPDSSLRYSSERGVGVVIRVIHAQQMPGSSLRFSLERGPGVVVIRVIGQQLPDSSLRFSSERVREVSRMPGWSRRFSLERRGGAARVMEGISTSYTSIDHKQLNSICHWHRRGSTFPPRRHVIMYFGASDGRPGLAVSGTPGIIIRFPKETEGGYHWRQSLAISGDPDSTIWLPSYQKGE